MTREQIAARDGWDVVRAMGGDNPGQIWLRHQASGRLCNPEYRDTDGEKVA